MTLFLKSVYSDNLS